MNQQYVEDGFIGSWFQVHLNQALYIKRPDALCFTDQIIGVIYYGFYWKVAMSNLCSAHFI